MSSYVSFWVKNKNGAVTSLCDFSRSSAIYQACNDAGINCEKVPNEKDFFPDRYAIPYTEEMANEVLRLLKKEIDNNKKYIEQYERKINLVKDMKNTTVEERVAYIDVYDNSIIEAEADLEEIEAAYNYINFLEIIRDNVSYGYPKDKLNEILWVGIDCVMKGEPNED